MSGARRREFPGPAARLCRMRRTLPIVLVVAVSGCKGRGQHGAPPAPGQPAVDAAPAVRVSWGDKVDIYQVLDRDPKLVQAVQVARRTLPKGVTVAPVAIAGYHVATNCGPGYCVDGIVTGDQLVPGGALKPCGVWTDRILGRVTHPSGVCRFAVMPQLSTDDGEILGAGSGSWLERGIRITRVEDPWVSFYEAQADFSAGAAHSNATMRCRSVAAPGADRPNGHFDAPDLAAANDAVHAFIARQRGDDDPRALDLAGPVPNDVGNSYGFLLTGPRSFALCLPTGPDGEAVRLVNVELPPAPRAATTP